MKLSILSISLLCISIADLGFSFSLYHHQPKPCIRISTKPQSLSDSFRLHSFNPNPNTEQEEKRKTFQADISEKLEYEQRDYENFGPFTPIAKKLDEATGDWALSYADLQPSTP
jgi:hypothetical protein